MSSSSSKRQRKEHPYYELDTPAVVSDIFAWGFEKYHTLRRSYGDVGTSYDTLSSFLDLIDDWNNLVGDSLFALAEIPRIWQALIFNPHKNRADRYRLFVFLWSNGMMAHHAVYWVMWHNTYDSAAWRSITDAANDTLTFAGLRRLARNNVYCMEEKRVVPAVNVANIEK